MCGISIIVNRENQQVTPDQLKAVTNKVLHRGPDDEGYFFGSHFALGHRRLSIIDTSPAGHQPMFRGNDCIVYNGMLYNYIELRNELSHLGYSFHSKTDTEVILASYQQWGTNAFGKFNGMWAIGIYDSKLQQLILCRDHFGIKPLHYTISGNLFIAGSEIKQFTALPKFRAVLNYTSTINFLTSGLLNYSSDTFFQGVHTVGAGHFLQYDLRTHKITDHQWYTLGDKVKELKVNEEDACSEIKDLFVSSVKMRMRSDVNVGSCLSGGIDSSSIVSVIHDYHLYGSAFTTFTSCYQDKRYDEQQFSDLVSLKTGFRGVKVFPELKELITKGDLDTMVYHQDQPFSSASHYSEFNIFRAARQNNIPVILDGQGSDEYLCGYPEFFLTYIKELISRGNVGSVIRSIQEGSHGRAGLQSFLSTVKNLYGYPALQSAKKLLGRPAFGWMNEQFTAMADQFNHSNTSRSVYDLSVDQITRSSIPNQLHSEDRNSMMFSIESRLPFLDHRLVEYVVGLPSSLKINKGFSKYIFRMALTELPEGVRWRKDKMGFVAPDKEWVKVNHVMVEKELKAAVYDTPFFSKELLLRFKRFLNGDLGYEPIYFRAMALNRFCKVFNMQM